ncbi:MAG: molybdate ABC transporter substrate-binding protein [Alteromonadaceae bacterium]|nr:molybdate ABC transporter substrate-binding protein [Alteromonadaceae bacterium]
MNTSYKLLLALMLLVTFVTCSYADTLKIAVASNFIKPMQRISSQFEREHGIAVISSFASSGKLYAQISHGAPYDLFLSADQDKPVALIEKGLALQESRFTYATGVLMLYRNNSDIPLLFPEILQSEKLKRIALANPKLAPYGRAAQEVLNEFGLLERDGITLVMGENIGQTYQFAFSGNVDIGLVALSQVIALDSQDQSLPIPTNLYSPIKQDAVMLNASKQPQASRLFLQYLKTEQVRDIITEFGYRQTP